MNLHRSLQRPGVATMSKHSNLPALQLKINPLSFFLQPLNASAVFSENRDFSQGILLRLHGGYVCIGALFQLRIYSATVKTTHSSAKSVNLGSRIWSIKRNGG